MQNHPDPDDLTPLICRLPKRKEAFIRKAAFMAATGRLPKRQEKEPVLIAILLIAAITTLSFGMIAVICFWLLRQAGIL